MTLKTDQAREQIIADRVRLDETKAELRELIHDRVDEAKRRADPRTYIREYPWLALGLVFGAGIALAMTGADRKAAEAVADAAVDAKDAIVEKVKGAEPDPLVFADGGADHPIEWPKTAKERVLGVADGLLYRAIKPILDDMRGHVDETVASL